MKLSFELGEKKHHVVLNDVQRKDLMADGCVTLSTDAKRRIVKKLPDMKQGLIVAGGVYNAKIQENNLMIYHCIKSL